MLAPNVYITSSLGVSGHVCLCVYASVYVTNAKTFEHKVLCSFCRFFSPRKQATSRQGILTHYWLTFRSPFSIAAPSGLAWPGLALSSLASLASCPTELQMSEVGTAEWKGHWRQWVLSVSPQSAGPEDQSSGMLGTRNFLLAGARKAPWFCGLALSKQPLFCSLLKLFVQTKGNCHGKKSTIFPAFAPLCASSHSMLSDCAFPQLSVGFPADSKAGFAALECESHLLWPNATAEQKASFIGWHLPCPKIPRLSQVYKLWLEKHSLRDWKLGWILEERLFLKLPFL